MNFLLTNTHYCALLIRIESHIKLNFAISSSRVLSSSGKPRSVIVSRWYSPFRCRSLVRMKQLTDRTCKWSAFPLLRAVVFSDSEYTACPGPGMSTASQTSNLSFTQTPGVLYYYCIVTTASSICLLLSFTSIAAHLPSRSRTIKSASTPLLFR